jgi:hypothetical protein
MWHEGEGKAVPPNISFFQGDRRDFTRKYHDPARLGTPKGLPRLRERRPAKLDQMSLMRDRAG